MDKIWIETLSRIDALEKQVNRIESVGQFATDFSEPLPESKSESISVPEPEKTEKE